MDFSLSHLFFNAEYQNIPDLFLRCIVLILASALVIWVLYFALIKTASKKKKTSIPRDYFLKQRFLLALLLFLVVFSVYIFFFIKSAGTNKLQWDEFSFYLNLLPQFLVYIGTIFLFMLNYSGYMKALKKSEVQYA